MYKKQKKIAICKEFIKLYCFREDVSSSLLFQSSGLCVQSHPIIPGRGLMLWLFVGPTRVYLLDFFCFGIQFYSLLSPYFCFISLLNLYLYVLGDDALIS